MVVNTPKGSSRLGTDASLALERLRSSWGDGGRKLAGHQSDGEYPEGQRLTGDGRKSATGKAVKLMGGTASASWPAVRAMVNTLKGSG